MTSPVVLVLDDAHGLHNSACRAAVSVLAGHVPGGSRLVLAGRAGPPLRFARLRAEGKIIEIGPGDLSLTHAEAASLLRDAGARGQLRGLNGECARAIAGAHGRECWRERDGSRLMTRIRRPGRWPASRRRL
jgi:ATP/maltotriose-dependent transcriptional regulator MalT